MTALWLNSKKSKKRGCLQANNEQRCDAKRRPCELKEEDGVFPHQDDVLLVKLVRPGISCQIRILRVVSRGSVT